jgi:hypothetical protein
MQLWPTHPFHAAGGAAPQTAQHADPEQPPQPPPQQLPLHISISRTVPIRHIQIESLKVALTKQLKPFKAARVSLAGLCALRNDAATRSFVGIRVAAGAQQVRAHAPQPILLFQLPAGLQHRCHWVVGARGSGWQTA